jgi:hypothetical protein
MTTLASLGIAVDGLGPKLAQGYEFWRGESGGAPVVAIATNCDIESRNTKTGAMVQVFIIRRDIAPREAVLSGADAAVCGDCPMRPIAAAETGDAPCYVATGYFTRSTLESVYRAFRSGSYPRIDPSVLGNILEARGLPVRQGTYGGPDIVPTAVWSAIDRGRGTSYTHQWRTADPGLAHFAMASVETLADAAEAKAAGWRYYRVDLEGVGPQAGEITCPAKSRRVTCADCGLCNGNRSAGAKNIIIEPIESKAAKARRLAALAVAA